MKLQLIFAFALLCCSSRGAERPNIPFCLADDWGWPHAGAYGDKGIKTPNFDRLAREGALFQHTYVSSPSCTPSRNAVITGKYHWELGPGANLWSTLPIEHESFVHMLRDAGYVTGRNKPKTWGPGKIQSWEEHHGDHPVTTAYNTFPQFIEKSGAKEKPFFFWLATSDPHRGYQKGSGKKSGIDLAKVHMFEHYPDVEEVRSDVADYYFEVQRWDTLVGSAIAELEKHGLLENTIFENRDKDDEHRRAFELCFAQRPGDELYDLKKDPGQIRNVAGDPEYREVLARMQGQLQKRTSELNDPRAKDPGYLGFDKHPYFGGGGGKRK